MTQPNVHLLWARNEEEALALLDLGWRFASQRPTHHHFWACLMRWEGKGDPPKLAETRE